jgi:hypothetical protein
MRLGSRSAFVFVLTCALGAPLLRSYEGPKDGSAGPENCVLGTTGHWVELDSTGKPLDAIRLGVSIKSNSCVAGDGGTLVVSMTDRTTFLTCDRKDKECRPSTEYKCVRFVSASRGDRGVLASVIDAALCSGDEHPTHYRLAVSRGLEPHVADSVIELEGTILDFAPAFVDMSPGRYRVRLENVDGGAPIGPVELEWSESHQGKARIQGIRPGLYRLLRLGPEGDLAEPEAWVLVDGPQDFAKDSAAFQLAKKEIGEWPEGVDPRAPGTVLRAYLESLSRRESRTR